MEGISWHFDYVRLAWDAGFCFDSQRTRNAFDLSSLGLINIDQVVADRDIAIIEKHLPTILQFKLDDDFTKILEPNFAKVFRLGQLSIQYLVFCKKYLDNTVSSLKREISDNNQEIAHLTHKNESLKSEISFLKKNIKELKFSLECQPANSTNRVQCPECSKVFANADFLASHLKRRHESATLYQTEKDKLQLEIKELKEKLNSTEKLTHSDLPLLTKNDSNENSRVEYNARVRELQEKFESLRQHVEHELKSVNDQKFYLEKYERWMELAFQKFVGTSRDIPVPELRHSSFDVTDDKASGNESSTFVVRQKSDDENINKRGSIRVSAETQTDVKLNDEAAHIMSQQPNDINFNDLKQVQIKMQEEINVQILTFQESIQDKVNRSLSKLEGRMNAFLEKLGTLNKEGLGLKQTTTVDSDDDSVSAVPRLPIRSVDNREKLEATETEVKKQNRHTGMRLLVGNQDKIKIEQLTNQESENEEKLQDEDAGRFFKQETVKTNRLRERNITEDKNRDLLNSQMKTSSTIMVSSRRNLDHADKNSKISDDLDETSEEESDESSNQSEDGSNRQILSSVVGNERNNGATRVSPSLGLIKKKRPAIKRESEFFLEKSPSSAKIRPNRASNNNEKHIQENKLPKNVSEAKIFKKPLSVEQIKKTQQSNKKPFKRKSLTDTESSNNTLEQESVVVSPLSKHNITVPKSSATSTLAKRSLTSLKQAVLDEGMREGLREEIQRIMGQRLQEMGVSPDWTSLPEISYKKAIIIVKHQASIDSKRDKKYSTIRTNILKELDKEIKRYSKLEDTKKVKTIKDTRDRSPKENDEVTESDDESENVQEIFISEKVVPTSSASQTSRETSKTALKSMYDMSDDEETSNLAYRTSYNTLIEENVGNKINVSNNKVKDETKSQGLATKNEHFLHELKQMVDKHREPSSEESESENVQVFAKSVLKTGSTQSINLAKKKVLFDLESTSSENKQISIKQVEVEKHDINKRDSLLEHQPQKQAETVGKGESDFFEHTIISNKDVPLQTPRSISLGGDISKSSLHKDKKENVSLERSEMAVVSTGDGIKVDGLKVRTNFKLDSTSIGSSVLELDAEQGNTKDSMGNGNKLINNDDSDFDISDILN